jgi:hypothetical protein
VSVFLAVIMTIFWYWYFLSEAKGWTSCLEEPLQCANGHISKWLGVTNGFGDIESTVRKNVYLHASALPAYKGKQSSLWQLSKKDSNLLLKHRGGFSGCNKTRGRALAMCQHATYEPFKTHMC